MRPHITLAVLTLGLSFAARADINSNATLSTGVGFNFDNGTTSGLSDIIFTGNGIIFQSGAKGGVLPVGTGSQAYSVVTQQLLQSLASFNFSTSQIPASALPVDTIVGIQTKAGNYAKFIVTSISSSSLAFQFTTFGVSGGGGGGGTPTITSILNNSSTIPVGFSNSGVAPSTLFVIKGNGMAAPGSTPVLQDSIKGLPTTLNGSSLSVSAGGNTYAPAIYYSSPTQIAAVLPAAVPVGQATLTVSYNGTPSAAASFTIVQTAYGISNYNGNTAVVQDAVSGALITPTSSAKPGQVIIIWGTGLGSDPADSDTTYTSSPHAISVSLKAYIGGVPVTDVAYAGQSVYPGVHVIGLTIPQGVPNGCLLPIVIVTGNTIVSNTPTMPVMANGGTCSDPDINASGDLINLFNTKPNLKVGTVQIGQLISGATTSNIAQAAFTSIGGSSFTGGGGGGGQATPGTCTITQINGNPVGGGGFVGLDAGNISLTGPAGNYPLAVAPNLKGAYGAQLPANAIPATGGAFTFNGTGGVDVGAFSTTLTFPTPLLTWTNQAAAVTVNRAGGLLVTWNGGQPGSYVFISGSSANNTAVGAFFCYAPQSALQFAVPSYILAVLPVGSGSTTVQDITAYSTFTAPQLDYGYAFGLMSITVSSTYQ